MSYADKIDGKINYMREKRIVFYIDGQRSYGIQTDTRRKRRNKPCKDFQREHTKQQDQEVQRP